MWSYPPKEDVRKVIMCTCACKIIDRGSDGSLMVPVVTCSMDIEDSTELIADAARHCISASLSTYKCTDIKELLSIAETTNTLELKAFIALFHNYCVSRKGRDLGLEMIFSFRDREVRTPKIGWPND